MIPWFDGSSLTFAGVEVPLQGPLAIVGLAFGYSVFIAKAKQLPNITPIRREALAILPVFAAIVGGHALALFEEPTAASWWQLAAPQSSLGAIGCGTVVGLLLVRHFGLPTRPIADAAALAFAFGWPVIRLGCVLRHDHPGLPSTAWLAVAYPDGGRWDLALLESMLSLAVAFWVAWTRRERLPAGVFAARIAFIYCVARLWIETLHGPAAPVAEVICFAIAAVAGAELWSSRRASKGKLRR